MYGKLSDTKANVSPPNWRAERFNLGHSDTAHATTRRLAIRVIRPLNEAKNCLLMKNLLRLSVPSSDGAVCDLSVQGSDMLVDMPRSVQCHIEASIGCQSSSEPNPAFWRESHGG